MPYSVVQPALFTSTTRGALPREHARFPCPSMHLAGPSRLFIQLPPGTLCAVLVRGPCNESICWSPSRLLPSALGTASPEVLFIYSEMGACRQLCTHEHHRSHRAVSSASLQPVLESHVRESHSVFLLLLGVLYPTDVWMTPWLWFRADRSVIPICPHFTDKRTEN